jgi:hypothetical protein
MFAPSPSISVTSLAAGSWAGKQFSGKSGQLPPMARAVSAHGAERQLFVEFEEFNARTTGVCEAASGATGR